MSAARTTVLYVHHGSGMGGAPQLLLTLIRALDRAQYEPIVWCIRRSSASALFEEHGIRVIYQTDVTPFLHISDGFYGIRHPHRVVKMLWAQWRSYRAARAVFAAVQPEMIHVNSVVVPGVLAAAARQPCPVVLNVLECVHPGYCGLRASWLRRLSRRWADAFVFMLPSEARRWGLQDDPRAISVFDFIPAPAPVSEPGVSLRRACGVADDMQLIGYFGRFTKAKGVHLLLRALGILRRRGVVFHAVFVGPVPAAPAPSWRTRLASWCGREAYITSVRRIIAVEQLEDRVTFTGEHTNVDELVPQCEILAAPFTEPHFSRLCGEAARAGRPAVAFAIDGPGEEIVDGVTGLLARPFDSADLAEKLAALLGDAALRERMGTAARAHAARVFSAETNVAAVMALYARVRRLEE